MNPLSDSLNSGPNMTNLNAGSPWFVGVDSSRFRDFSLGSDPDGCGPTILSDAFWYISGVQKSHAQIREDGVQFGLPASGVTDYPALAAASLGEGSIPCQIYHPSTPQGLSYILWKALWWKKFISFYSNLYVSQGHFLGAVGMSGTTGSPSPFDSLIVSDPAKGAQTTYSYSQFLSLVKKYVDGNYYAMVFNRLPADLTPNTQMGPA